MSDSFKNFPKDLFDGFDPAQYEGEVQERWGESDAYRESMRQVLRLIAQNPSVRAPDLAASLGRVAPSRGSRRACEA